MHPQKILGVVLTLFVFTAIAIAGDITGVVTCKGARDAGNVVVYLETVAEPGSPPTEHALMNQSNLEFVPHVLPVVKGTTVDYLNSDDVLHNVFTPDKCADKMNLGSWPKGETRSYTYNEQGCVSVMLCNVHPEMEAWVVVLQNEYFSKTDKAGNFTIEGVPAGDYKLVLWHEKLKGDTVTVTVPDTGSVTVSLEMHR